MRLYLFPITRSRTLIYCKRTLPSASSSQSSSPTSSSASSSTNAPPPSRTDQIRSWIRLPAGAKIDFITSKANGMWADWESTPTSPLQWKKRVTTLGNSLFAKIPYPEWGLKSIPPLSAARAAEETRLAAIDRTSADPALRTRRAAAEVDVVYPARMFRASDIRAVLGQLASGTNQAFYRKRMWWSVAAMPVTIPFAVVPVVPNLPFFYATFRAWSYWRAGGGALHIRHLLEKDLVNAAPSQVLQRLYDVGTVDADVVARAEEKVRALREGKEEGWKAQDVDVERAVMGLLGTGAKEEEATDSQVGAAEGGEKLLYPKGHGRLIGLTLNMPEVEVELERAYDQVSKELRKGENGV